MYFKDFQLESTSIFLLFFTFYLYKYLIKTRVMLDNEFLFNNKYKFYSIKIPFNGRHFWHLI